MDRVHWCPYRLKLEIQMTRLSRPVIFTGEAECREKPENEEPSVNDVDSETSRYLLLYRS